MNYEIFIPLAGYKNKPNSNPNKANSLRARMNVNSLITKDYRKKDDFAVQKNKPNPSGLRCLLRSPSMRRRMTHCRTDQTQFQKPQKFSGQSMKKRLELRFWINCQFQVRVN